MADYHPLIARAVEGLENSTGEARRALYERARAALVSQLRSIEPALSEADITRERLALEDAIRKVEAESVRKTRSERPAPPRASPAPNAFSPAAPIAPRRDRPGQPPSAMPTATPGAMPSASRPEFGSPASPRSEPSPLRMQSEVVADDALRPATPGSARARLLNARTSPVPREGLKSFRNVVNEVDDLGAATAKSAQSARDTRDSYGATPAQQFSDDEEELPPIRDRLESHFVDDEAEDFDDDALRAPDRARRRFGRGRDGGGGFRATAHVARARTGTLCGAAAAAVLSRSRQARGRPDRPRRPYGDDLVAVVQHHRPLQLRVAYEVETDPDGAGPGRRA